MKKDILSSLITLYFLFSSVALVAAQSDVFSDDFSNGLSKWSPIRDDGRFWSVSNQVLQAYIPFMSTITELTPVSFPNDLQEFEFSFEITPLLGADKNISFGVADLKNWYEIHFGPSSTQLTKLSGGVGIWSYSHPYTLLNNNTYQMLIRFVKGEVSLFIDGVQIFTKLDPTFISYVGKVGLKASTGSIFPTKILFDNVKVSNLEKMTEFGLNVTLIKQTDPAWANLEYDTATQWASTLAGSPTSFKDWACNLVAQVMLLKYHGITTLPDSSLLTPVSYNQWLLDNNGYYNSPHTGNINRLSPSKLSAIAAAQLGTPKLEYQYVSENMISTAVAEIEKGNPVILELEGHFVLADGFTTDKTDLLIKDPGYTVEKLSQHPKKLKSLRLYTPSHTDLSYVSVISSKNVEATFTSQDGAQKVAYLEQLQALNQPLAQTPVTQVIEVRKPLDGSYQLAVSNTSQEPAEVTLEITNAKGDTQELYRSNSFTGSKTFELSFSKDGSSTLAEKKVVNYANLHTLIDQLYADGHLKNKGITISLQQLVKLAENSSVAGQQKTLQLLAKIVTTLPQLLITTAAKNELTVFIQQLVATL